MRRITVALALALAGCIAVGRESYTTLSGGTPLPAADDVPVSRGRTGHGFAQDPTAARAQRDVVVSVCDWDAGFWVLVFPPIPIPLISSEDELGLSGTTLVRVTFEGAGPWKAKFADLAMVGPDGKRVTPMRYRVVLEAKAESLGEAKHANELEPCARAMEPKKTVDRAHVAVLGPAELWLTFDSQKLGEDAEPIQLALDGFSHDDRAVPLPRLTLDGGSRWFWYRVFP